MVSLLMLLLLLQRVLLLLVVVVVVVVVHDVGSNTRADVEHLRHKTKQRASCEKPQAAVSNPTSLTLLPSVSFVSFACRPALPNVSEDTRNEC